MHLAAGVVDILDFGKVVALAGGEVVDAVGGCGVDGAGALVGGDVGGDDAEDGAVEEGVLEGGARRGAAVEEGQDVSLRGGLGGFLRGHQVGVDDDFGEQGLGDDVDAGGGREGDVFHFGMEGDGERRGQGPGSGGPDDGVDIFAGQRRSDSGGVAGEFVADVDGGEVCCSYSTSASARAVRSWMHQETGFRPL